MKGGLGGNDVRFRGKCPAVRGEMQMSCKCQEAEVGGKSGKSAS